MINSGSILAALLLGLDAVGKASSRHNEGRQRIADLKLAMRQEGHRLSWELSTKTLDGFGLESCDGQLPLDMGWTLQSECGFCGQSLRKAILCACRDNALSGTQEAMTNIAKHAQAKKVRIVLEAEAGERRLTVEDDGIGFGDANKARCGTPISGFGLFGIRECLAYVGGSLIIGPASDHGTVLFCRIHA
jgi:two-component system, chemotaxis family, sensor kinase Cph1